MPDEPTPATTEQQPKPEPAPILTQHELALGERTLRYQVQVGRMPLKKPDSQDIAAHIFYMAYTLEGQDAARRPLIFVFNGGPGSASVWLHLGALGPQRVKMQDEGWMPAPPYRLVPNEHTWLDLADLVFIDPVGTGYSRAVKPEEGQQFWSVEADLKSVGEFIRLFLTHNGRWSSPLFLAGESYGTTRAAGLAAHLFERGIALNGLMLISTVLNFQTLDWHVRGNDLPFMLYLPTYTATAWYHKRLADDLQARDLADVLAEVEDWSETTYAVALAKGDRLPADERSALIEWLVRYTGLSARVIDEANLRPDHLRVRKELLRDERLHVGRLDSRFKGHFATATTEIPDFDPALTGIGPPYTAMINDYVRRTLSYETDLEYEVLNFKVNSAWEWERGRFPDTSEALRSAFERNPFMHVFVGMGLYDLATPHFATIYTLDHMDLDPNGRAHLHVVTYRAGHMFYLDIHELAKLKADVTTFMAAAQRV
jgi:carboxypeptidase C (cathepsin A)